MSFIDKFLDLTTNLPREIVRSLKLFKTVEERSRNINNNLKSLRTKYLKEINENDNKVLLLTIEKYYKELLTLSDYKQEIIKEINYILDFDFIKNLPPIIEEGKKECQEQIMSSNANLPFTSNSFANPNRATTDDKSVSDFNDKKKKTEKLLGNKMNRTNKNKTRKRNLENSEFLEDIQPNDEDNEITCFCNRQNFGNMIMCENCKKWFHFGCVGYSDGNEPDNESWYCTNCTRTKEKKKKKKH